MSLGRMKQPFVSEVLEECHFRAKQQHRFPFVRQTNAVRKQHYNDKNNRGTDLDDYPTWLIIIFYQRLEEGAGVRPSVVSTLASDNRAQPSSVLPRDRRRLAALSSSLPCARIVWCLPPVRAFPMIGKNDCSSLSSCSPSSKAGKRPSRSAVEARPHQLHRSCCGLLHRTHRILQHVRFLLWHKPLQHLRLIQIRLQHR